jgi:alkylhydroperoxidase family enzyme
MWIRVVRPDEAEGLIGQLYDAQIQTLGNPTEITMLGSLYPELADIRSQLYRVVESCPSSLTPMERQGIALAAAAATGSAYIASGVESKFLAAGGTADQAARLRAGDAEFLSPPARTLARYARRVAGDPESVTREDVEACREAGATDLDVLDANNLAGYYSYLARVCLGLGVRDPVH